MLFYCEKGGIWENNLGEVEYQLLQPASTTSEPLTSLHLSGVQQAWDACRRHATKNVN